jgi:magnesium transporter
MLLKNCLDVEVTRPAIEQALMQDTLLWLNLMDTDQDTLDLLRDVFKIHPLAIEDAQEFNQRPKIEDYEDFVYIVAYGSVGLDRPMVEVHCFYAEHFFVSVHRDKVPAIADAYHTLARLRTDRRLVALYRLIDALVDSMFPFLAALDDRIDELQDQIFAKPTEGQLAALFALKRQLVDMRKVVTPQRDTVNTMLTQVIPIPGMTAESERYVRDLYDHLIRISDMVDSYRDLLSGSLDAYMSVVSNRLNDVMKQLTIIATIFLPLSFLTGFFGQNFGWLVERLGSVGVFLGVGLGTEVVAVVALLYMFRRRGWMLGTFLQNGTWCLPPRPVTLTWPGNGRGVRRREMTVPW